MTPEQLSALKAELQQDPAALGYSLLVQVRSPDSDYSLAELLNAPRAPVVDSCFINARTIMATLGPTAGAQLLDTFEAIAGSVSAVRWALKFVATDAGIDIGELGVRAMIGQLVQAGVAQSSADALLALALRPGSHAEALFGAGTVVTPRDVAAALES